MRCARARACTVLAPLCLQFLDVKGVSAWSLDRLCGAGNVTHKAVIHWAQGGAVAWLLDAFRHEQVRRMRAGVVTSWLGKPTG